MNLRIQTQWRRDPFSLGPYILVSRRGLTIRLWRAVACLAWGRR